MKVIAHRGSCKKAPENTLAAFKMCVADNADGVEFDTYQHGQEIVVFHDRWLDRTTNGKGRLTDTPLHELRKLDAGRGERIPLLSETLACFGPGMLCNVEIKYLFDVTSWLYAFDKAMEQSYLHANDILISSFHHNWLADIKRQRPAMNIGALTASYPKRGVTFATKLNAWSVNIAIDVIDERYVQLAHREGLTVLVFTVDYPDDMLLLKKWGVDGIFTNIPDVAKRVLSSAT